MQTERFGWWRTVCLRVLMGWILAGVAVSPAVFAQIKSSKAGPAGRAAKRVVYVNRKYGFRLRLPDECRGFSIEPSSWNAPYRGGSRGEESGPRFIVHCPAEDGGNENVPIMVFTRKQWVRVDDLELSASPYGPGELGSNRRYVFALPARWEFATDLSPDEIWSICQTDAFRAFNP